MRLISIACLLIVILFAGAATAAPSVQIKSPDDAFVASSGYVTLSGTAQDAAYVQLRVNDGPWALAFGNVSWYLEVVVGVGKNVIEVKATDAANNSSPIVARTVYYQSPRPSATIDQPVDQVYSSYEITLTGTASAGAATAGLAAVLVRVNRGEWLPAQGKETWSLPVTLSAGANNIEVQAVNAEGNHSGKSITLFGADPAITPPAPFFLSPTHGGTIRFTPFTIAGMLENSTNDVEVTRVEVRTDGGSWKAATGVEYWELPSSLQPGPHRVTARSRNASGAFSPQITAEFQVELNPPEKIGTYSMEEGVDDLDVAGALACIVGVKSLTVLDVQDPAKPERLSVVPTKFKKVAMMGHYALAVTTNSLQVLDLKDPRQPVVSDTRNGSYAECSIRSTTSTGEVIYAPDTTRAQIDKFSLSESGKLISAGALYTQMTDQRFVRFLNDMTFVRGTRRNPYTYIATEIYRNDISLIGSWGGELSDLALAPDLSYRLTSQKLTIANIWASWGTVTHGTYSLSDARAIKLDGPTAYIADYQLGLVALDTTDPTRIIRMNDDDTTGAVDVVCRNNLIYTLYGKQGLVISRPIEPSATRPIVVHEPAAGATWRRGAAAGIDWAANIRTAGTAVGLELWRAGAQAADLGVDWDPNGAHAYTFTVPGDLAPGADYTPAHQSCSCRRANRFRGSRRSCPPPAAIRRC